MKKTAQERKAAYRRGLFSEYLAAAMLILKGYSILAHRYRCRSGEIDLIARRGKVLVFVEVKNRKKLSDALEAIGANSRRRIVKAAKSFASGAPQISNLTQRFDVVAFYFPFFIRHIENAWFAED